MERKKSMKAILVLEDGSSFEGRSFGAQTSTIGEIVFSTSMTGYQENLTDPSYAGQILVQTAPHIGNTGVNSEDNESSRIWVSGLVVREYSRNYSSYRADQSLGDKLTEDDIPAIEGVDTRAITRKIRDAGTMRAGVFVGQDAQSPINVLLEKIHTAPSMNNASFTQEVTTPAGYVVSPADYGYDGDIIAQIVAVDLGIKARTPEMLAERGVEVHVVPATYSFEGIMELDPDGVFYSNGPGDPSTATLQIANLKKILDEDVPFFGICFGNQLLGRALGFDTYKLKFGHRGINQPVLDKATGRVEITAHNHGFAVDIPREGVVRSPEGFGDVEVSHLCLNDDVVEGIQLLDKDAFSVQYHPEAAAGPHDSAYLFDRFISLVKKKKERSAHQAKGTVAEKTSQKKTVPPKTVTGTGTGLDVVAANQVDTFEPQASQPVSLKPDFSEDSRDSLPTDLGQNLVDSQTSTENKDQNIQADKKEKTQGAQDKINNESDLQKQPETVGGSDNKLQPGSEPVAPFAGSPSDLESPIEEIVIGAPETSRVTQVNPRIAPLTGETVYVEEVDILDAEKVSSGETPHVPDIRENFKAESSASRPLGSLGESEPSRLQDSENEATTGRSFIVPLFPSKSGGSNTVQSSSSPASVHNENTSTSHDRGKTLDSEKQTAGSEQTRSDSTQLRQEHQQVREQKHEQRVEERAERKEQRQEASQQRKIQHHTSNTPNMCSDSDVVQTPSENTSSDITSQKSSSGQDVKADNSASPAQKEQIPTELVSEIPAPNIPAISPQEYLKTTASLDERTAEIQDNTPPRSSYPSAQDFSPGHEKSHSEVNFDPSDHDFDEDPVSYPHNDLDSELETVIVSTEFATGPIMITDQTTIVSQEINDEPSEVSESHRQQADPSFTDNDFSIQPSRNTSDGSKPMERSSLQDSDVSDHPATDMSSPQDWSSERERLYEESIGFTTDTSSFYPNVPTDNLPPIFNTSEHPVVDGSQKMNNSPDHQTDQNPVSQPHPDSSNSLDQDQTGQKIEDMLAQLNQSTPASREQSQPLEGHRLNRAPQESSDYDQEYHPITGAPFPQFNSQFDTQTQYIVSEPSDEYIEKTPTGLGDQIFGYPEDAEEELPPADGKKGRFFRWGKK